MSLSQTIVEALDKLAYHFKILRCGECHIDTDVWEDDWWKRDEFRHNMYGICPVCGSGKVNLSDFIRSSEFTGIVFVVDEMQI